MGNLDEREKRILYNSMHTHDLRNYARSVGVKSATNKKKSEIVDLIIGIENGTIEPHYYIGGGKGRPPKSFYSSKVEYDNNYKMLELENKKLKQTIECILKLLKNLNI